MAHEDDAIRAVRAALELRSRVASLQIEELPGEVGLSTRAGIDSGDIVVGGSGGSLKDTVAGQPVTSAYRLQLVARAGDVVVGPGTQRQVRGAAVLKPVSDEAGTTGAWRVLDVVRAATGPVRHFEGAMIGRQDELARLRTALRRAVRSKSVVRCLVVGEAGIGKSRLIKEFVHSITDFYTRADDLGGLGRAHFLMGCIDLRAGIATAAEDHSGTAWPLLTVGVTYATA